MKINNSNISKNNKIKYFKKDFLTQNYMKEENEIKSSNSIHIVNSKTIKQLKFQRIKSPFKNDKKKIKLKKKRKKI